MNPQLAGRLCLSYMRARSIKYRSRTCKSTWSQFGKSKREILLTDVEDEDEDYANSDGEEDSDDDFESDSESETENDFIAGEERGPGNEELAGQQKPLPKRQRSGASKSGV